MLRLKDNFRPNAPISQVPASWFNAVASFLNNLIGGYGVKINKNGAFPIISINPDVLSEQSKYKPTTEHTELETPSADQHTSPPTHPQSGSGDNFTVKLIDTTWKAGGKKGVKVYLPTDSWADGVERFTAWRLCEFDSQGRLRSIGKQSIMTSVEL